MHGHYDGREYVTALLLAAPGDRLVFVSDGVYDAIGPTGDLYGESGLVRTVIDTAELAAARVPGAVLADLALRRAAAGTADDAMVVCLDWFGPDLSRVTAAAPRPTALRCF
ncbi:SpoIIE family protein phosphatase [Amycolatopsis plumensis]|uniref:SpoIIE family protein phosphatase n=1 Tax=Amycolatopsis plumensis TaxID=236508 RepID=A0ABV5U3U1_9PSEU